MLLLCGSFPLLVQFPLRRTMIWRFFAVKHEFGKYHYNQFLHKYHRALSLAFDKIGVLDELIKLNQKGKIMV